MAGQAAVMADAVRWRPVASALGAWRQLTVRQAAIPATIGLVWGLGNTLGWWIGHGTGDVLRTAAHFLYEAALPMALLVLGLAIAESPVHPGPPRATAYAVAAFVAAVAGEALFVLTAPLLGVASCGCNMDRWPEASRIANMLPDGLMICGFLAAGYYFRRRGGQRTAALRSAQLEGAQLARQTLESKLQTMRARVEPEFLFDTLVEVQRLHETDERRADRILDQLIVYLRAALPQLHEATSTLGKEIDLAHAYLAIRTMRRGDRVAFSVTAPAETRTIPFAPMVILPLIDHAVGSGTGVGAHSGSIEIVASLAPGRLRLVVRSEGTSCGEDRGTSIVDGVRIRLAALYGDRATLDVRDDGVATTAIVEISYDPAGPPPEPPAGANAGAGTAKARQ